jgi:hypothetical protein
MKLSELIRLLKLGDPKTIVPHGYHQGGCHPDYTQLAFAASNSATIGDMLAHAKKMIGLYTPLAPKGCRHEFTGETLVSIVVNQRIVNITLPMVLDWIEGNALPFFHYELEEAKASGELSPESIAYFEGSLQRMIERSGDG